ncbi:MAG: hypothetical protein HZY79_01650 [Rhodoblastus sp.]|nr:MAG: hypothetical protein HZY79_01650 [Rhodoblastus sp.]
MAIKGSSGERLGTKLPKRLRKAKFSGAKHAVATRSRRRRFDRSRFVQEAGTPRPERRGDGSLHEQQQQRDEEREDAKTFGERGADEGAAELAVGGRGLRSAPERKLPKIVPTPTAATPMPIAARPAPTYLAATGSIVRTPGGLKRATLCCCDLYQWPG